jgi:hypothetical protein
MSLTIRFFIFTILLLKFFSCDNQQTDNDKLPSDLVNNPKSATEITTEKPVPAITFQKTEHDFGRVIQGEKITYNFKFKNTGTGDLIITRVSASCGCTAPAFTRDPVKPGDDGIVRVTFDSENRMGFQNKIVTVVSNSQPANQNLRIKAQVIVPENI